ncbi:unnamed protein product [Rotaria sordida]|uniref:F-box domain-containing protein n=1 Tax=Rotaria sordida TaxID=392033 RepID=A0A815IUP2_9BILA|nr:unnamed protein product [Rotaria sordida]
MSVSSFEILFDDILYEIFRYLSPVDILQSFFSLNKRLSRVIINEHLWHIHIGDSTMSLLMFNDHCHNILKLIGGRLVSLRLTLINVIGGWSFISSSFRYHQTTLLQRLHLIDIKPHEFDKLLRNHLIKQLHTLLVDVTPSNSFNCLQVEGIYLVKVCSRMPLLKICRLPFNHDYHNVNKIENNSLRYQMTLPNLLNRNHLRTLTIGIHTSCFLERLLLCIPLIENLSFAIKDQDISANNAHDQITSCKMSTDVIDLFPRANTLSLYGYKKTNRIRDLANSRNSISSLVPWSLLTHIQINGSDIITQYTLKSMLQMAYNVHTLEIFDDRGILFRSMLHNKDNFGTRINQQIKSLNIFDITWTLQNVQRFCTLLSNQFPNLKTLSFTISDSYLYWQWKPSCIIDGKNKSTKRIVNLISLLVDHLQQLVWLEINFCNLNVSNTPCFPNLIRRQLHQYPLSRPCRLRCSNNMIQIWM